MAARDPNSGTAATWAISLVVLRPDRPGAILMGVRSQTATSRRHPNVLSTPTMRVPRSTLLGLLEEVYGRRVEPPPLDEITRLPAASRAEFGGAQTLATASAFVTEALLARKLGAGDLLVNGRVRGQCRPIAFASAVVPDPATEHDELTHMLTFAVGLDAGADELPHRSESYSELLWLQSDRLEEALQHNDALRVAPHLDLMVCVYGLCVQSAVVAMHGSSDAS